MTIDLSPGQDAATLIDAIWAVRRGDRIDQKADVVSLLEHPSPIVREEVLSLLFVRWKETALRNRLLDVLNSDPDPGVRSRAAGIIAIVPADGNSREERDALRRILLNPGEDSCLRKACYESLYQMAFNKPIQLDDEEDLEPYIHHDWLYE